MEVSVSFRRTVWTVGLFESYIENQEKSMKST
jgi:hypothetical protein